MFRPFMHPRDCCSLMGRLLLATVLGCGMACASGCGGVKLVPVSGTVLVDGKPAERGSVLYKPDTSKGNLSPEEPMGVIASDGSYKLMTRNNVGAPPGAYKVVVFYFQQPKHMKEEVKPLIPMKYNDVHTTPLEVEVVDDAAPGSYDLKIPKK